MQWTTVGRVSICVASMAAYAAALITMLYHPPGSDVFEESLLAREMIVILLIPSLIWLGALLWRVTICINVFLDRDDFLRTCGRDAVGTSIAAIGVGCFVRVFVELETLPPSCPHPPQFILALTFFPAVALLVGLGVAFAWSLAARTVRARKAVRDCFDEECRWTPCATGSAPGEFGPWTPGDP
jgi:hypothetical protein